MTISKIPELNNSTMKDVSIALFFFVVNPFISITMPADLNLLVPEFREKVEQLLLNCKKLDLDFRPSEGLRSPFVQARYWRRSNVAEKVNAEIASLKSAGANYLAFCLESVGPQPTGAWLTNAIPGYSWHQWGEAVDCLWYVDDSIVPRADAVIHGQKGYEVYATEARKLGLDSGYFWKTVKDPDHVQLRAAGSPASLYSLLEIDKEMQKRFEHLMPAA